jgi:hypothetical protein
MKEDTIRETVERVLRAELLPLVRRLEASMNYIKSVKTAGAMKSPRLTPSEAARVLLMSDRYEIPARVIRKRTCEIRNAIKAGHLRALRPNTTGKRPKIQVELAELLHWDEMERSGGYVDPEIRKWVAEAQERSLKYGRKKK